MKDHQSVTAKARKIPVCSPKPSEALLLVFQGFCSLVRHLCTLFCHLLFSVCCLPALRLHNPEKKKAMAHNNWFSPWKAGITITGLESTLSSSNLQVEVHSVSFQEYCSSPVNYYGFISFLCLYMGSDQKQSCHGQAQPESGLLAVQWIFCIMQKLCVSSCKLYIIVTICAACGACPQPRSVQNMDEDSPCQRGQE